jgi:hypothetical protein
MRVLWIGKQPSGGEAGDEVFDRRTIAACRAQGHAVDVIYPEPVRRLRKVVNLCRGLPHYRTRFASAMNIQRIREIQQITNEYGLFVHYDLTVCSWEPLDVLVCAAQPPVILILHNITSQALPVLFRNNLIARLESARAAAWERRLYRRGQIAAIGTLSTADYNYVRGLDDAPKVLLLPPGMPPCLDLQPGAAIVREIVLSGTFDWYPKRRDALRFAREYAALDQRMPVRARTLPPDAAALIKPLRLPTLEENRSAIRFGVITDRFEAGHKLKTTAYVANNLIVLTFADVGPDFAHIRDHELFIRRIRSVAEIADQVRNIARIPPPELRERFMSFKHDCMKYFSWDTVAANLLDVAHETQNAE